MKKESNEERSQRILKELKAKYPKAKACDLDGRGMHFVCEVEPVEEHPEYDKAVEVIIKSKPHKHLKMTQHYTILSGTITLHIGKKTVTLHEGNTYTIFPKTIHYGESDSECWLEIYSTPGWTKEDHIVVE